MAIKLAYRTKSAAALKDLQKVFFCASERDRERYFDSISEDLFRAQSNISVWYPEGDITTPEEEEAYLSDLSEMNLFAVPVTGEFLATENRARIMEFAFAVERHIPILPIMQEQGLEARFNAVCGNLQILNKDDPDPTALPYEEKLKLFLDTVLLKDETIAKIRQAFAAYIFLSYRKKDRKHAQEVMRLIHKNPFARDIAIWYDEFLTPGEDFNESIRAAFEKSGLFSMVVTPNLLEKPNYVMTTEYPMAREAGKRILPVMAVPTDGEALQACYPGLPDSIPSDERHADLIEGLIREALSIRRNDAPEHKFFMGLAYLSGIDLETDHEKARRLITEAAEAGVDEALLKLVSMYETGQGVERDYEKSAFWQQRYADALEKRLSSGTADKNLRYAFFRAANKSGAKWASLYQYDKAWIMFRRALAVDTEEMTSKERIALLETCLFAASIAVRQKDFPVAESFLPQAEALSEAVHASMKEVEEKKRGSADQSDFVLLMYRAEIMHMRGSIRQREKKWTEAIAFYKEALPLFLEAVEQETNAQKPMSKRLIYLYGELAFCIFEADKKSAESLNEAKEYSLAGIDLADRLIAENISLGKEEYTILAQTTLMQVYAALGELDEAEKTAVNLLEMAEERCREEESIFAMRHLSSAHALISTVEQKKGDLNAEAEHLRISLESEEKIGKMIGVQHVALQLKTYYRRLAEIAADLGKWEEHGVCTERLEQVALAYYPNDGQLFTWLGTACCMRKDIGSLLRGYECWCRAIDLNPKNKTACASLDSAGKQVNEALIALRNEKNAGTLKEVFDRLKTLADAHPDRAGALWLRDRAESDYAYLLSVRDDLESKETACVLFEDLAARRPNTPGYAENLRITRAQVAMRYYRQAEQGDRHAAGIAYELYRKLAEAYPDREYGKNAAYVKNHFLT